MASLHVPPLAGLHNPSRHSDESLQEAKGNLRLQPANVHTQSLDGRLQSLDGRTKPANGDCSMLREPLQHAAIVCAACCECNRSVPGETKYLQGCSPELCQRPGSVCRQPLRCTLRDGSDDEAEKRPFRYGALRGCLPVGCTA